MARKSTKTVNTGSRKTSKQYKPSTPKQMQEAHNVKNKRVGK